MSLGDSDIVIAAKIIAAAIDRLGNADAATPMGAIEGLAAHIGDKLDALSSAMSEIAGAIDALDLQPKNE